MSNYFIEQAKIYANYHTQSMTKVIHAISIFLILFSFQIFFSFVKITVPGLFATDLAWLLSLALLVYYFKIQWKLAVVFTPILYVLNYGANLLTSSGVSSGSFEIFFLLMILGGVAQFIGYSCEKEKRAIGENLRQMLLSPLFLIAELFFTFSMMNSLYFSIYEIDQETIEKRNRKRFEENNDDDTYRANREERRKVKRRN